MHVIAAVGGLASSSSDAACKEAAAAKTRQLPIAQCISILFCGELLLQKLCFVWSCRVGRCWSLHSSTQLCPHKQTGVSLLVRLGFVREPSDARAFAEWISPQIAGGLPITPPWPVLPTVFGWFAPAEVNQRAITHFLWFQSRMHKVPQQFMRLVIIYSYFFIRQNNTLDSTKKTVWWGFYCKGNILDDSPCHGSR